MGCFFWIGFWVLAVTESFVLGWWAFEVHGIDMNGLPPAKQRRPYLWHQRAFNFLGALAGWLALAYFLAYRWVSVRQNPEALRAEDFVVLAIAFYGITGFLPYAALIGGRLGPR